jgi:CHAT domain-containing protein
MNFVQTWWQRLTRPDHPNTAIKPMINDLSLPSQQSSGFLAEALDLIAKSPENSRVIGDFLTASLNQLNPDLIKAIQELTDNSQAKPTGQRSEVALGVMELSKAIQGLTQGDINNNLRISISGFQSVLRLVDPQENIEIWRQNTIHLGIAYHNQWSINRAYNYPNSKECFQSVLAIISPDNNPELWAKAQINLGNLYSQNRQADGVENYRLAAACYESALAVVSPDNFPELWAKAQNNLGILYGSIGKYIPDEEKAIACYQSILEVISFDSFPEIWIEASMNLGLEYIYRRTGSRPDNLELGLTYCQDALDNWSHGESSINPGLVGRLHNNLGLAYESRIQGVVAENLELAIHHYLEALKCYEQFGSADDRAGTQTNLGNAYCKRIREEKAENIEIAIVYYNEVLKVYSYESYPYEWARTKDALGTAYQTRIRGERRDNLEQSIAYYQAALTVRTREAFPKEWAETQNNLGVAYADRIRGVRWENIETAIGYYKSALEVYTRDIFPENWAKTQMNLGNAYGDRIRGERTENQEQSIACYHAALTVQTRQTFPEDWAGIQVNLGLSYRSRIQGKQAENLEQSIAYYEAALKGYTRDTFPEAWAKTQMNLGAAYSDCIRGKRVENLEQAIAYYKAALKVLTRQSFPEDWAKTQNNLGQAYASLGQNDAAIRSHQLALEIRTPTALPLDCLQTGRNLGNLGYDLQNWEIAIEGYNQAILAIEQSRYWATSEATKRELIANSLDIYQKMVQACINHQDYAQALLTVERSKSRTLIELLDSAHLYPKNATDAQKQRISDLRRQIAIYQQQLAFTPSDTPATENHPNQPSPQTLIRQQLQAANQQFQDLLTELDDPNFTLTQQVPAQLPDLRCLLQPQTALIEWYLPSEAESGFYLFLVTRRRDEQIQIIPHHFSATDRQHLDQALLDYRSDYGQPTWKKQLPQRLETLSAALQLPRLLAELSQIQHLILIPHRELHLIPLHALPVSLPSPSGNEGKPLQDWFPVQYAPSCQILNNLQQRPPLEEPSTSFFALQNPTQDLTYADFEVKMLRRLFNPQRVLSHDQATKTALEQPQNRAFLQQSRYVHFSCHGEFSEADPLNAYLRLANREKLTFQNIFTSLDIPNCRLLIMSACKTGLVETPPTDDYVGLASAFFFAGTRTVVGSLWEAEEFSAALLMIRLYQELPRYTSVVMALRAAQDWLRTISRDGVLTWLRDELKLEDSELKTCEKQLKLFNKKSLFTSARYWAPFTVSGQLDRTGTSPQHHQS